MKHHGAGLLRLTRNQALVEELTRDYTTADAVLAPERAMLDYAAKLTRTPWAMKKEDVAALVSAGFPEESILEINQVAAYFAYVNRIADGLGVELEPSKGGPEPDRIQS